MLYVVRLYVITYIIVRDNALFEVNERKTYNVLRITHLKI